MSWALSVRRTLNASTAARSTASRDCAGTTGAITGLTTVVDDAASSAPAVAMGSDGSGIVAWTHDRRVYVVFEGVAVFADVYVNGHHLGHYPNGYVSFYYDVGPFIKKGENVLVVRVDNSRQPNSRWYSGSGIYRHVWLNIADKVHIVPWITPAVVRAIGPR